MKFFLTFFQNTKFYESNKEKHCNILSTFKIQDKKPRVQKDLSGLV